MGCQVEQCIKIYIWIRLMKIKNKKAIHIKTGDRYLMLTDDAICTTNAYDQARLVIYTDGDKYFVRDYDEFYEKITVQE